MSLEQTTPTRQAAVDRVERRRAELAARGVHGDDALVAMHRSYGRAIIDALADHDEVLDGLLDALRVVRELMPKHLRRGSGGQTS